MKKKESSGQFYIGGQAVMEGVMMRGREHYSLAVRGTDKQIQMVVKKIRNSGSRFFKLPIVRGIAAFINSLITGVRVIYESAEMSGMDIEEENPSKFDLWLEQKFGDKLYDYIMGFSVILAVAFCVGLFMVLPAWIASFITPILAGRTWAIGIIEGLIRIGIFILYLFLITKTKSMKRLFGYHGAEHKTINCFEGGQSLTVENVRQCSRLHKRCGTSFLLIVMLVSMAVFLFIRTDILWLRILSRVLAAPFIAGFSYEIIRWAGKNEGMLVKIVSTPGMIMQKLTTSEPDDGQIETAICAVNSILETEPFWDRSNCT